MRTYHHEISWLSMIIIIIIIIIKYRQKARVIHCPLMTIQQLHCFVSTVQYTHQSHEHLHSPKETFPKGNSSSNPFCFRCFVSFRDQGDYPPGNYSNIAHLWKKMHLQNAFEKGPWLYSSPEGTHIPIHITTKQNNISIHHSEIAWHTCSLIGSWCDPRLRAFLAFQDRTKAKLRSRNAVPQWNYFWVVWSIKNFHNKNTFETTILQAGFAISMSPKIASNPRPWNKLLPLKPVFFKGPHVENPAHKWSQRFSSWKYLRFGPFKRMRFSTLETSLKLFWIVCGNQTRFPIDEMSILSIHWISSKKSYCFSPFPLDNPFSLASFSVVQTSSLDNESQ